MSDALDCSKLRSYTNARVGLRRAGTSLATSELLDMAQCLAEARDAVHAELSTAFEPSRRFGFRNVPHKRSPARNNKISIHLDRRY